MHFVQHFGGEAWDRCTDIQTCQVFGFLLIEQVLRYNLGGIDVGPKERVYHPKRYINKEQVSRDALPWDEDGRLIL